MQIYFLESALLCHKNDDVSQAFPLVDDTDKRVASMNESSAQHQSYSTSLCLLFDFHSVVLIVQRN